MVKTTAEKTLNLEPSPSSSFLEAYDDLHAAVATVRNARLEDLDALVQGVSRGAAAHAACKERLKAVRALLAEHETDESSSKDLSSVSDE